MLGLVAKPTPNDLTNTNPELTGWACQLFVTLVDFPTLQVWHKLYDSITDLYGSFSSDQ